MNDFVSRWRVRLTPIQVGPRGSITNPAGEVRSTSTAKRTATSEQFGFGCDAKRAKTCEWSRRMCGYCSCEYFWVLIHLFVYLFPSVWWLFCCCLFWSSVIKALHRISALSRSDSVRDILNVLLPAKKFFNLFSYCSCNCYVVLLLLNGLNKEFHCHESEKIFPCEQHELDSQGY